MEGESTSWSCSTSRNNHIGLSVVQVRMAGPGCLTDDCPQCPSHKSRLFALVYLLIGAKEINRQVTTLVSTENQPTLNWVGCDSPLVSRKLIQAHGRQCLGTSNATSKGSDSSGKALGECSRSTSAAQVRPGHDHPENRKKGGRLKSTVSRV